MAGRSPAPKPRKTAPAKRQRHSKKVEYEPVTEKDVTRLINCLAEWTRDLQAVRAAATVPPRPRSRSGSSGRGRASSAARRPPYPRGHPLTESMEFRDRSGVVWLVYIEGRALPPSQESADLTALPERHLRFDSATESRYTPVLPAGSPFLPDRRLQSLLDGAREDLPSAADGGPPAAIASTVAESSTRAVESSRWSMEDRSRWLRQAAGRSVVLGRHLFELLVGAVTAMHGRVEVLLAHRAARP